MKQSLRINVDFQVTVTKLGKHRYEAQVDGAMSYFQTEAETAKMAKENLIVLLRSFIGAFELPTVYGLEGKNFLMYPTPMSIHMLNAPDGEFGATSFYQTKEDAADAIHQRVAQDTAVIPEDGDPFHGDPRLHLLRTNVKKLAQLSWYAWQCSYRRAVLAGCNDHDAHARASSEITAEVRDRFMPQLIIDNNATGRSDKHE